jgi:hypothetical protein
MFVSYFKNVKGITWSLSFSSALVVFQILQSCNALGMPIRKSRSALPRNHGYSIVSKLPPQTLVTSTSLYSDVTSIPQSVNSLESITSNQPKYGNELDLPGTYVRCGRCFTNYAITVEDLGSGRGR